MTSPTVTRALFDFSRILRTVQRRGIEATSLPPVELVLRPDVDPPRLLAAMPSLRLSAKGRHDERGWGIDAVAMAPVGCPPPGPGPMFEANGVTVMMEQQLCKFLEQEGWISSYTAKWSWSVRGDDPRLEIHRGAKP